MTIAQMSSGLFENYGRPPPVERLLRCLILAATSYTQILIDSLGKAAALRKSEESPPTWAWPEAGDQRRVLISAKLPVSSVRSIAGGTDNDPELRMAIEFIHRGWPELLGYLIENWNEWRHWIAAGREALPGVARWMDRPQQAPHEKWTHQTEIELDRLEASCHWTSVGKDGRSLWRHVLPADLPDRVRALQRRIDDLRIIRGSAPIIETDWTLRLSPGAVKLWEYLGGRFGVAKDLAAPSALDTSEQTIREWVSEIRRLSSNQRAIVSRSGYGYFRPDRPPDWTTAKPQRQARIGRA
jgi:hypothetical protein